MKLWHAEMVHGTRPKDLELALQRIEDADGSIMGMTSFSGPYPSWTVVWYTIVSSAYEREKESEG